MDNTISKSTLSTTGKRIRVAFYMRVSTQEQELEGYSPEFQLEQLHEHVKRKDYKGWVTKPEWHFFDAKSGGDTIHRPKLQELMELVRKKEVDLVLVWKIDRMSRKLSDLLELFEEMDKYGVGFASVKEDLDFTGAIGKLIFQIFGALAEFERENIKMRTEEGRKASAKMGNYIGGSIPYGYRRIPNPGGKGTRIAVAPEEAEIVKKIFAWFMHEDRTYTWIATELTRLGVRKGEAAQERTKGARWYDTTIRKMLSTEEYRGIYVTNRFRMISTSPQRYEERPREEWISTPVDSIIDSALYYMTQERILTAQSRHSTRGGGKELYMLRGKLVDVQTGRKFVGYLASKGTKNYRRKQFNHEGLHYPSMSVAAKPVEDFVWRYIEKAILQPEEFLRIHKQNFKLKQKKEKMIEELRFYEDALSNANGRIDKVQNDFYNGGISEVERNERVAKYKDERDAAFAKKAKVEANLTKLAKYDIACEHLRHFSEKFKGEVKDYTYEKKQKLVDMLVDAVEIIEIGSKRVANASFRFDPKEVSASIPGVKPVVGKHEPKSPHNDPGINGGGG